MVQCILEPEREYTLTFISPSTTSPIIINTVKGTPIPIHEDQIEKNCSYGIPIYRHTVTFYNPIFCTVVDYFLHNLEFKDAAVMKMPHNCIPNAYLNCN